jgi:hypothetical protein
MGDHRSLPVPRKSGGIDFADPAKLSGEGPEILKVNELS